MRLTQLDWEYVEFREQRLLIAISPYLNSLKNWWKASKSVVTELCRMRVLSQLRFDTQALSRGGLSFAQTFAVNVCAPGRYVLQLGTGHGDVSAELKRKLCRVTATRTPTEPAKRSKIPGLISPPRLPGNLSWFDHILVMDLIEHLPDPKKFLEGLRKRMARRGSEIVITVANVAFVMPRIMLALSSRRGGNQSILSTRHPRLFTFKSLHVLLESAGFEVVESRGVPAPFLPGSGDNRWSGVWLKLNQVLVNISKRLFAHQICIRARPVPEAPHVFRQTRAETADLPSHSLGRAA